MSSPRGRVRLADLEGVDPDDRLVIGVGGRDGAVDLARDLLRLGLDGREIRVDDPDDLAVVGRGRQRDEADASTVSIVGLGNQEQRIPGWTYSAAAFAVGFVIGAAVGPLFSMADVPWVGRSALVGLCFGLAAAAIGFVYGLSRGPELAGQGRDAPTTSVLSVPVGSIRSHGEAVRRIGTDPVTSWWLAPPAPTGRHSEGTARHPDDQGTRGPRPDPRR